MVLRFALLTALASALPAWAQTSPDLRGIYIYTNDVSQVSNATAGQLTQSFNLAGVDGVAVVIGWNAIEPAKGVYQWTVLDQWIGQVIALGKKIDLVVPAGSSTPAWLFQAQPVGAGAVQLIFTVSPHAGATGVCDTDIIPPPWDTAFLAQWDAMLTALSAHLKSAGTYNAVTLVRLTGINRTTEELRLPAETAQATGLACVSDSIALWQQAGYRPSLLLQGWNAVVASFMKSFPDKPFSVSIIPNDAFPGIAEDGSAITGRVGDENEPLLQSAAAQLPGRLVVQFDFLMPGEAASAEVVAAAQNYRTMVAFQTNEYLGGQGAGCSEPVTSSVPCTLALYQQLLETGIYPLGQPNNLRAQYIEVFHANATALPADIQLGHNELFLMPLPSAGQVSPPAGGNGSINLTFPAGYAWAAASGASWLTFTGSSSGTGSGTLSYVVAPNNGAARSTSITVAGFTFTVEQQAGSVSGLRLGGTMPHIAAQEHWSTTVTLVNRANTSNQARLSLFGSSIDSSGNGNALPLLLNFPQQPYWTNPLLGASVDNTLAASASWIVSTAANGSAPVETGSAQVLGTGALGGFAIFHRNTDNQEAVVPLTLGSPNASSYLLAFDNTGGIATSVAVANVSAQAANIGYIIRDDAGRLLGTGNLALPGSGQTSFVLPDTMNGFPATIGQRGTVEFDTPAGGQISVLGIRNTSQTTANGTVTTLTTVPALSSVGTGGGSFAFIASGGDGWQTTFVLINAGGTAAPATLRFFDPNGNLLALPISYPQTGAGATTVSSITRPLAPGATLIVQSTGAPGLLTGSAQLTTTGSVSGFVIFRHNGQEAVVPMESRNAQAYLLAFDNTSGTATGLAVNAVSAGTQPLNIPVVVRDDTGAVLSSGTLPVAANGDFAADLGQYSPALGTVLFPETANIRGTIEFDAPAANVQIGIIGIRTPAALTYTSLPALVK